MSKITVEKIIVNKLNLWKTWNYLCLTCVMEIIQDVIQRNNPIELMMYMFAIVFTESINLNCFHKLQKSLIDLSVQLLFQNWWESLSHNLLPYPQIIQRGHSRIVNVERRKTIVFLFLSCFDPLDHPKASNEPFFSDQRFPTSVSYQQLFLA